MRNDPAKLAYSDSALAPVTDEALDALELFTHNDGAREAVSHARKIARLTHTERVATEAAAPAK